MQGLIVLTLEHIFKQDIKSLLVSIVMLTLHKTRSCVMSKIVYNKCFNLPCVIQLVLWQGSIPFLSSSYHQLVFSYEHNIWATKDHWIEVRNHCTKAAQ